jgi:hypothetical protein
MLIFFGLLAFAAAAFYVRYKMLMQNHWNPMNRPAKKRRSSWTDPDKDR